MLEFITQYHATEEIVCGDGATTPFRLEETFTTKLVFRIFYISKIYF